MEYTEKMTTVYLEEDCKTGELILPIPEDILHAIGASVGDTLYWHTNEDGTVVLSKDEIRN
jgi:hypothetical protein